jgi:glycogen(starch) synthase
MKKIPILCALISLTYWFTLLMIIFFDSPLVMKVRSRSGSVVSGTSTPGGGAFKSLSEGDLRKADAALSQVNGTVNGHSSK